MRDRFAKRSKRTRRQQATISPCIDCGRLTAFERCSRCESIHYEQTHGTKEQP